ncbi:cytochrome c biogenesis protein ResB [Aquimarina pacifica]|uniref:cytochrome c biogenesis protein ResB n=1 Tax=Aquimarina pacifica TaxID=1296415 RepID=UPI0004BBCBD5|nr:cytochrome c biogenesis protein ResB [Aquimarina pacifica]
MNHILKILFSNRLSGVLLLIFALAMALATFIENDYGTETARALIYSAKWFEILILLLAINFIGNIAKYNLFSWQKAPIFLFHLGFIIIILGAGVTKYRGYEALMTIKEGEDSNRMISIDSYLQVQAGNGSINKNHSSTPLLLSELGFNSIHEKFDFDNKEVSIKLKEYIPRAKYTLEDDNTNGKTYLHVVIAENEQRRDFYIEKGKREVIFGIPIAFESQNNMKGDITIKKSVGDWLATFPEDTNYFSMLLNKSSYYPKDSLVPLQFKALSTINNLPVVFNEVVFNKTRKITSTKKDSEKKNEESAIIVSVESGKDFKEVTLLGGRGYMNPYSTVFINGIHLKIRYGSKPIPLPFSLFLKDFTLERYPGSDSPSAFYSDFEVQEKNKLFNYTIFMNNVLNHRGYRFFQSAYLPDESGTILSVNKDYWGTLITYIGYGALGFGMFISLFWKNSHFAILLKTLK